MAGMEGIRPQRKEAAFDAGQPQAAFSEGERYERSEVHYGGMPQLEPRLRNGQPKDIAHLYTERQEDGQLRWWTERQSLASWRKEVRAAHERGDPRYENIPETHNPASVTHNRASIYRSGDTRVYAGNNYAFVRYVSSSDQHYSFNTVQVLNEPVTTTGRRAEPGGEAGAGREGSSTYETVGVNTAGKSSGKQEQSRTQYREGRREDATSDERGNLYEDIGLSAADFKARVAEMRELLRAERQRYGENFNEAEFLRERIDERIHRFVDEDDLDRKDDLIELYEDLSWGWDIMAFSRYSLQTQGTALEQEESLQKYLKTGVMVRKKAAAMLDIMATAIDLPHVPGQQADRRRVDIPGIGRKELDYWIKPL